MIPVILYPPKFDLKFDPVPHQIWTASYPQTWYQNWHGHSNLTPSNLNPSNLASILTAGWVSILKSNLVGLGITDVWI